MDFYRRPNKALCDMGYLRPKVVLEAHFEQNGLRERGRESWGLQSEKVVILAPLKQEFKISS